LVCTAVVVWLSDLHPWQEAVALAAGAVIGGCAGTFDARSIERRVDAGGGLDLYDEDVIGFVIPVAILASSPFAFGSAIALVAGSPAQQAGLQGVVCSLASFWVLHDVVLGRRLKRLELRTGPLRIRRFYARSVVGPQGLIGQPGVVARTGARTYVRVRGELWEADSAGYATLTTGQRVIVRAVNGLRLTVAPHESSDVG
jgi:membrane protein implicated in regulation of membrane protease activity